MISNDFINDMGGPRSKHFVVGVNFGDEGKGHITNTLCKRFSQSQKVVNSRYNGGPQAGHTVYNNGERFVFSSLPSGMKYINIAHYHPNKFMVFNPVDWLIEYETYQKVIEPRETPVMFSIPHNITPVTFYDVNANRIDQRNLEHGSCGMGIGKTILRSTYSFDNRIGNLNYTSRQVEDHIRTYLKNVKEVYYPGMTDYNSLGGLSENAWIDFYIHCYLKMRDIIRSVNNGRSGFYYNDKIQIFEGAQGIGLDRASGYYPYVTPSFTGSKEIVHSLEEIVHSLERYFNIGVTYVSRVYLTRHGNSVHFQDVPSVHDYFDIVDKTNIPNQYQGSMKFDYFDLRKIIHHINYDSPDPRVKYNFALTCVDQIKDRSLMKWKDTRGRLKIAHFDDFIHQLKFELKKLNFKYLLISSGVEPEDVEDHKL